MVMVVVAGTLYLSCRGNFGPGSHLESPGNSNSGSGGRNSGHGSGGGNSVLGSHRENSGNSGSTWESPGNFGPGSHRGHAELCQRENQSLSLGTYVSYSWVLMFITP